MTLATMVGVDGGQRWAMMWVMTWAMMWATRTMAVTTLVMTPAKRMVGMPAGRGGGLLAEDAAVTVATATAVAATAAAAAAYCWCCVLFIVKIFLCVKILSVGGIGKVTPPLTLSSRLRYVLILGF
jgi:hypothetical protein